MNWKRIVIAAIWSELLLAVVYVPLVWNDFQAIPLPIITAICMLVFMFLGGFWAVRGSASRFLLQGLLVGFFANILWYFAAPLLLPDTNLWRGVSQMIFGLLHPIKILAAGIGGRRSKKGIFS